MSETSLSDLITALLENANERAWANFHALFLVSELGIEATGLPSNRAPGETFQVGASDRMTTKVVQTPDGRSMVKACADPHVFARRYPDAAITAGMRGRDLLEMVMKSPELDGVLVCSAVSFHSVPIGRADAERLLRRGRSEPEKARPWWKFWG
jgi:hypothetical protein